MNLAILLDRAATIGPSRPAVTLGQRREMSYGEVSVHAGGLAYALTTVFGLDPGDRVVLLAQNCPEYVECLFACWRAGLVVVPVNAKLHPREIAFILTDSGARAALVGAELASVLSEALTASGMEIPVVEIASADYRRFCSGDRMRTKAVGGNAPAWLFYTSGTTGRPKGATLTHRNLMTMTMNYFVDVDTIAPDDCILHAAPMSHGSGLYILPHVAAGALQIVPESCHFDPDEIFRLMARFPNMSFFAAPTMVNRLVNSVRDGSGPSPLLKSIVYGGGPMHVADAKKALACFGPKLVQIYGQGESPMTITVLPKALHSDDGSPESDARLGSVGYAQCSVEVKIADADGRDLPNGEIGEILVRGDTVMAGYWNNEAATRATIVDGWLHTGDVGTLDESGLLTLKDRAKDMIISGGTNIYPREVEEALLQHPMVEEVSVLGMPEADWGEQVVACVVVKGAHLLSEDELNETCARTIARFKRPKRYVFVTELPKNNYGKVLKTELRKSLESRAGKP